MALFRSTKARPRRATKQRSAAAEEGKREAYPATSAAALLLRPHVTEKSGKLSAMNQYVFVVADSATKPQVSRAVTEVYGVRPLRVETMRIPGKKRRLGSSQGMVPGFKKAVVTLPEGKTIEAFPK